MRLYTGHNIKILDFLLSSVTEDLVIQGSRYMVSNVLRVQTSGKLATLHSRESGCFLLQMKCLSSSVETYTRSLVKSHPRNTKQDVYMTITRVTNYHGKVMPLSEVLV